MLQFKKKKKIHGYSTTLSPPPSARFKHPTDVSGDDKP